MRDLTVGQACDVFTETTGQPWVVRQIVQTGLSPMFWFNPSECWFRPSDGKALARWPDGFRARMNFQDGGAILEQTSEAVYVDHVTTPDSVMVSPARPLRVPISEISYRRTEVMAAAAVFKSIPAPRPDAAKTKAVHGALVSYPEQIRQQVIQEALQQLAQQNAADHPATNPAGKQQTPGHGPGSGTISARKKGERWTPEALKTLKAYREEYGTEAAAKHYGMTTTRIRALLPKPTKKPSPWPGLGR